MKDKETSHTRSQQSVDRRSEIEMIDNKPLYGGKNNPRLKKGEKKEKRDETNSNPI